MPADPAFQHGVIAVALALLTRDSGPVLEDYPVDAPAVEAEAAAACPVSFANHTETAGWEAELSAELAELMPWYEFGVRRRGGRTLVGVSGGSPEEDIASLGRLLDSGSLADDVVWLKRAVEDLKVLYLEAMTAQPGAYDTDAIHKQLWHETALGAALLELFHQYQDSGDARLQAIARMIAPREAVGATTGPGDLK